MTFTTIHYLTSPREMTLGLANDKPKYKSKDQTYTLGIKSQKILTYFLEDENQTTANLCHTQCFIIADSSVTFGLYQETNRSTLTKSGFLLYKFFCFYEKK